MSPRPSPQSRSARALFEPLERRTLMAGDGLGDTIATAADLGELPNGQALTITKSDSVNPNDIQDVYKFTTTGSGNLTFTLGGLSADADLQLLNAGGKVLKKSSANKAKSEKITATITPGTYYLNVFSVKSGKAGFATTNYDLGINGTLIAPAPPPIPIGDTNVQNDTQVMVTNQQKIGRTFTLTETTDLRLRFVSDLSADCFILNEKDVADFNAGLQVVPYITVTGGISSLTLGPGDYVIVMRNLVSQANTARYELDRAVNIPGKTRTEVILPTTATLNGAQKKVVAFTVKANTRYFLDGANTGVFAYVIPNSEVGNFQRGPNFKYFAQFSGTDSDAPGYFELNLPPGSYALAFVNPNSIPHKVYYDMESWG